MNASEADNPPPYSEEDVGQASSTLECAAVLVRPNSFSSRIFNTQDILHLKMSAPFESEDFCYPVNICFVVDVSKSMKEIQPFSSLPLLAIVKQMLIAVIRTMKINDWVGIVTFGEAATEHLAMTRMDYHGKLKAIDCVNAITYEWTSNLCDGLSVAVGQFNRLQDCKHNHGAVVVITDGPDNLDDENNVHQALLKALKQEMSTDFPIINTIGFGPRVNYRLLNDLAEIGDGQYTFARNSEYLGPSLFYMIASLKTMFARKVCVEITIRDDNNVVETLRPIEARSVLHGQSRDILVPISTFSDHNISLAVQVSYRIASSANDLRKVIQVTGVTGRPTDLLEIFDHMLRYEIENLLRNAALLNLELSIQQEQVRFLKTQFERTEEWSWEGQDDRNSPKYLSRQLLEIQPRIIGALNQDVYENWGRHYLLSLAHVLGTQTCNHIDLDVQVFVSPMVEYQRRHCEELYQIGVYSRSTNPCFSGSSVLSMADGLQKRACEIMKGDIILVDEKTKETEKVACVLKTPVATGICFLVQINSHLSITPYHPFRVDGQWKYPIEISNGMYTPCNSVYSFVLESVLNLDKSIHDHTVIVGGVQCATLGHGLTGDVIEHDYFGTDKVLEDLKGMPGWEEGLVIVSGTTTGRDGRACGLIGAERIPSSCLL